MKFVKKTILVSDINIISITNEEIMFNQFNGVIAKFRNEVKKRLDVDECATCHQLRKKRETEIN